MTTTGAARASDDTATTTSAVSGGGASIEAVPFEPVPFEPVPFEPVPFEPVPGYELIRVLAQTAFANTFEARSARTGARVVVKALTRAANADASYATRLLRDTRVVAGLRSNRHIARVIDMGDSGAGTWVAVEHLDGAALHRRVARSGPLPVVEALAAARDAARALDSLWGAGVVHRNIKPSSLLTLPDGTTRLTDVGFTPPLSLPEGSAGFAGPTGLRGAAAFLAPELVRGGAPDVRSDVYALGCTLFALMTGRHLFDGTVAEVLAAHDKRPVPAIATLVPGAPMVVVDLLYRLLQKDPGRRPAAGAELVRLLEDAIERSTRARSSSSLPAVGTLAASGAASGVPSSAAVASSTSALAAPTSPRAAGPGAVSASSPARADPGAGGAAVSAVVGTLRQMSVVDILQMLEHGHKSARVEICIDGDVQATLHIHDGQLVDVRAGAESGEAALRALLRHQDGTFRIHDVLEACERSVLRPTTLVLLDALRALDEARGRGAVTAITGAPQPSSRDAEVSDPARVSSSLEGPATAAGSSAAASKGRAPAGPAAFDSFTSGELEPVTDTGRREAASVDVGVGGHLIHGAEHAVAAAVELLRDARRALDERRHRRSLDEARSRTPRARARVTSYVAHPSPRGRAVRSLGVAAGVLCVAAASLALLRLRDLPLSSAAGPSGAGAVVEGGGAANGAAAPALVSGALAAGQGAAISLSLGHAHAERYDFDQALALYRAALEGGVVDARALAHVTARLDAAAPDEELALVALWPDDEVEDVLALLALDPRPRVRAHAVEALLARGAPGRIDAEQVAILDVQQRACAARRAAVRVLRIVGRSRGAIEAVQRARAALPRCVTADDVREVRSAVARRL